MSDKAFYLGKTKNGSQVDIGGWYIGAGKIKYFDVEYVVFRILRPGLIPMKASLDKPNRCEIPWEQWSLLLSL
jgi:hypothetical protein